MKRRHGQQWEHFSNEKKEAYMAAIGGEVKQGQASADPVVPVEGKPETYPPNLFSGAQKRLDFADEDKQPGFVYRWANDDGPNVPNHLRSGWVMVERSEARMHSAATPLNNDLGSHIRQIVGTKASGEALYAYLMKKPEWLDEQHRTGPGSREEYHQQLMEQVRQGTLGEKAGERRYSAARPYPGSPGSLPGISITRSKT